ncbi:hypothetical protein TeGR_g3680, partial [Tetraparma gracilis]
MGKSKKKPVPLVHPMKSRKVQRRVTTEFHKRAHAKACTSDPVELAALDSQLEAVGGRSRYQEASQLGAREAHEHVAPAGGVRGLPLPCAAPQTSKASPRRNLRLLEVGVINTQLLDAASKPGVRLSVRALDL